MQSQNISQIFDNMSSEQKITKEPIAIIGIGCRFPGRVDSAKSFWRLLLNKGDVISEWPSDRFNVDAFYDPTPGTPGKIVTRAGGFLKQIDRFDPSFFGISPREANQLDPQQRLLLEITWEALEDSGQVIDKLDKSDVGVFIGLWHADYQSLMFNDLKAVNFYATTGGGSYSASGRISYILGLQGPSITVNTHCSSSLVAVHLGCQSLWSGESSMVLAGGANLMLQPHISIAYSQSQMLSPDGRCKFGDAHANGYVRSEGAGLVVLKRLSQAVADGDPIYAVIRGSAVANDGQSGNFLATPSRKGQETLLRRAYKNANISPAQVQYVEAHGTGTKVGDQVEIQALDAVLSDGRSPEKPCAIGSVKTNIGHTEAAAGIAGLIKVALMLKHRAIPASLHLQELTPQIPWHELPLTIPTELTPWPAGEAVAVAGVSSFGIAGTNAHVVLAEAPPTVPANVISGEQNKTCLLPLSAHTPQALKELAQAYKTFLAEKTVPSLPDICYSAACHRAHMTNRLAVVGSSHEEMVEHLEAFLQDAGDNVNELFTITHSHHHLRQKADSPDNRPLSGGGKQSNSPSPQQQVSPFKIVFVLPGQGSQWVGMGRQLLQQETSFRQALEQCEQALSPFVDWSLLEQIMADEDSPNFHLNDIDVIQPVLVCIEIALAALWRSWGIEPDAVIGHSMGEVAAAYIAGALSLADAMHIICSRSRFMRQMSGQGSMAVVELSLEEVQPLLVGYEGLLSIASINSPRSIVLAGDPAALDKLLESLQQQGIFNRKIKVDVASHSFQMEPLMPKLQAELINLQPQTAAIPIYSTTLGTITDGSTCDAAYWAQNLRNPPLFSQMVQQLLADGYHIFISMGPHPILLPAIQQGFQFAGEKGIVLPSLHRREEEQATLLTSLADLYRSGYPVNWHRLHPNRQRFVPLPLYPWQRERFWYKLSATDKKSAPKPVSNDQQPEPQAPRIREAMLAVEPGRRRRAVLAAHLREQVGQVLRLSPSRIPPDQPLKMLGLDSLMSVELKNRLELSLELTLSSTLIWNSPTIDQLVTHLAQKMEIPLQVGDSKTIDGPAEKPSVTGLLADHDELASINEQTAIASQLDEVSEDEVASLLAEELEAIDKLLSGG